MDMNTHVMDWLFLKQLSKQASPSLRLASSAMIGVMDRMSVEYFAEANGPARCKSEPHNRR